MPQERLIDTGRVKLNCMDWPGGGSYPLVMLHGGAWCWQEFLSLIPTLAKHRNIFALDLRGNGRSGWASSYRLADFTDDTVEFLRRVEGPLVLMGHSIGGVIALMSAARCPDKVRGIVIEDVPVRVDYYQRIVKASREMFRDWLAMKSAAGSEEELSCALAEKYAALPEVTSTWLLFFARCLWLLDPAFFNALLEDFHGFVRGYDAEESIRKANCPILFLRGEPARGAVMADDELSWVRTSFPNVRCAEIEGVGHLLHLEQRGASPVLAEISAFFDAL